ncbi:MAG: aspartyl protease family protein [Mucilaginibacter sp.]|nr:aspartyl protease family protein [Mucilaginibacter sp.]
MNRLCLSLLLLFSVFCCNQGLCIVKPKPNPEKPIFLKKLLLKTIADDPQPYGDYNNLVVPIKRAGNLIIVEAQIDTMQGNFILDTGAPYLVLNTTYFRNMPKIDDQESGGVNGASAATFTTVVKNFSILDLHYSRLTADVTDLSALENGRRIKILGLLGTRLFSKLAITVDLFHNQLYIHKLNEHGDINPGEQLYDHPQLKTTFSYTNDVISFKVTIKEKSRWFAFDTGSEASLLDYNHFKKAMKSMEVINRSKLIGVGGTTFEIINTKIDSLTIGNVVFLNNRVTITNLEKMSQFYGQSVDGVLGFDFFVRGIFTINFVKKEFEMYIYSHQ